MQITCLRCFTWCLFPFTFLFKQSFSKNLSICPLYNYADDNILAFFHSDMDILRTKLDEGSNIALDWFNENHMNTNSSKFQSITLRPKGSISDVSFCISEHILKPIPRVKLLGVKIDDRLSFDDHISSICLLVSYQINGLRRNMKYMTIENLISIYNAFLAANFPYCNTVWHFCSNRGMYMLEKVHKKALRVVLNDYISSYRDLLDKVSKPTLYVARIKAIAIDAYKCCVNENPPYINAMFDSVDKPYNLRGGPLAEQPKVDTTYSGLNTFTYQAAKIWNSLPSHLKEASSLFDFKQRILKWPGPICQCGCCVYTTHTMFYSYILKNFTSFTDAFYWLLMNRHVFSTWVFYMFRLIFTCIIPIDHFSFSRLIAPG